MKPFTDEFQSTLGMKKKLSTNGVSLLTFDLVLISILNDLWTIKFSFVEVEGMMDDAK